MILDSLQNKNGFLIEKNNKKHLVVVFGGINQGIGIPVFEFFNILKNIECDKVFVRDFNQLWYLKGVDSQFNDFDKLLLYLKQLISGYTKVSFIGNSMGGFGSYCLESY